MKAISFVVMFAKIDEANMAKKLGSLYRGYYFGVSIIFLSKYKYQEVSLQGQYIVYRILADICYFFLRVIVRSTSPLMLFLTIRVTTSDIQHIGNGY